MLASPLAALVCAVAVSFASLGGVPRWGRERPQTPASFGGLRTAGAVPEVADPDLPDTAMAEMTSSGPVILFNPALYRAAGPARPFVRAHEYGHVLLGHLENEEMLTTRAGRARAEAEADCFAARSTPRAAVLAMVELVRGLPPEPRDAVYGTKPERARRILACAGIETESETGVTASAGGSVEGGGGARRVDRGVEPAVERRSIGAGVDARLERGGERELAPRKHAP
jgi:hypothetical protein